MAELVTIPIAVFEIVTDYERPELALWVDRKFRWMRFLTP